MHIKWMNNVRPMHVKWVNNVSPMHVKWVNNVSPMHVKWVNTQVHPYQKMLAESNLQAFFVLYLRWANVALWMGKRCIVNGRTLYCEWANVVLWMGERCIVNGRTHRFAPTLKICIHCKCHWFFLWHYAWFLVFSYSFFKEISFALQWNHFHKIEWILSVKLFL